MYRLSCVQWAIIITLASFILIGVPLIIYYKIVQPQDPTFFVNQASVAGFNLTTNNHLSSFFDIRIQATNPNKKLKLKYRRVRVSTFKNKQNLGTVALPDFSQRKGDVTMLRALPIASNLGLKKSPAFDFGVEKGKGYVMFDVFMTAFFNGQNLEVNCKNVVVNFTTISPAYSSVQNFQAIPCSVFTYTKKRKRYTH